ncbi:MAG: hypothetical protein ACKV2O_14470 [Acidimicrobiales bacterium]
MTLPEQYESDPNGFGVFAVPVLVGLATRSWVATVVIAAGQAASPLVPLPLVAAVVVVVVGIDWGLGSDTIGR